MRLHAGTHHYRAVLGAGNGTLHEDERALGVDARDLEQLHGSLHVAEVARHALAGEHPARVLRHADRAGTVVRERVAVRGAVGREVVALDDAGEALAERRAGDIALLPRLEHVDLELGAALEVAETLGSDAELAQLAARLDARLGRRS